MGQLLARPIVEKHSNADKNERLTYGASAMQGWRICKFHGVWGLAGACASFPCDVSQRKVPLPV